MYHYERTQTECLTVYKRRRTDVVDADGTFLNELAQPNQAKLNFKSLTTE